jgi:predicted acyl esterase
MRPERDKFMSGTRSRAFVLALATLSGTASTQDEAKPPATYKDLPSETPARFEPTKDGFDHVKRDVMIPMPEGVKLHAVLLIPNGAKGAPILLTRTPYDASKLTNHAESAHLGPVLNGYDNAMEVSVEGGLRAGHSRRARQARLGG